MHIEVQSATGKDVEIVEVSPRDGLQNEQVILSTDAKFELVERVIVCGLSRIEATSFVNPSRVPQIADAAELAARLPKSPCLSFSALALNQRGVDQAINAGFGEINTVIVATDTFGRRNQNTSTDEAIAATAAARATIPDGVRFCVTVAAAFGCPFEGEVSVARMMKAVHGAMAVNPDELVLADTIGVGSPADVKERIGAVLSEFPNATLRLHFHNTRNTGIANAWAGVEAGVTRFDASLGGVGGCPFVPRATGNIATEDLVYMFERAGIDTGVDLDAAIRSAEWLEARLDHDLPGMVMKAGGFPQQGSACCVDEERGTK